MLLEFQRDFARAIATEAGGPTDVYRNTVVSGCVDALRANYPVVARLLGDEMFDSAAAAFAAECPPRVPVLASYGERFSQWLELQPWVWDVAYVPDVARIERLHIESLFAADADALDMRALEGETDWKSIHLSLHPATRFAWLSMPAISIWQAQRDLSDKDLAPDWRPEGALVTRPGLEVHVAYLDGAGHRFLLGIHAGHSVLDAGLAAGSLSPDSDIGSLFTSLVNAGAFVAEFNRSVG